MPTYQLISSNTLSSGTMTVTFSSIPQTYTDLLFKLSVRSSEGAFTNDQMRLRFNGSSATNYNFTLIRGDGSGAALGDSDASNNAQMIALVNTSASKVSTFSNVDIYIPNYTNASNQQQIGAMTVMENDTTTAYITTTAGRYANNAAISSVSFLFPVFNSDFLQYSSFYLYGISNA
jgi:hypothetical protein